MPSKNSFHKTLQVQVDTERKEKFQISSPRSIVKAKSLGAKSPSYKT